MSLADAFKSSIDSFLSGVSNKSYLICNITFAASNYIAVLPTADSDFLCG